MKTKIFNLIIIDESGSMESIKQHAINSVNETIQTIRSAEKNHENQEHYVNLVTFNNEVKTVYECVSVNEVKELTAETYRPACCTALYDAMGISLNALMSKVAEDDKVLVTIVTDGMENASKEYNQNTIHSLIEGLKKKGWVFAYIGANHDVKAAATAISITNVMQFQANDIGMARMSHKLTQCRNRWYDKVAESKVSDDYNMTFFDENKD